MGKGLFWKVIVQMSLRGRMSGGEGRNKSVKKKNKQKKLVVFYLVFDTNARNYSHKMVVIGYWGYNQGYDSLVFSFKILRNFE